MNRAVVLLSSSLASHSCTAVILLSISVSSGSEQNCAISKLPVLPRLLFLITVWYDKLKKFDGVKNLAVHFFFTKGITEFSSGIAKGVYPVLAGTSLTSP
jgi:hypothetical protein